MSNTTEVKTALPTSVAGMDTSTAAPKLRRDLVISRQTDGDSAAFVVKDPASGRFFRFRAIEGFVLEQLDGACPLEAVRSRTEAEFSAALPAETLEQFLRRLRVLGLLEADAPGMPAARSGGRVRGNLFHLRLRLWDPDWFFTRLVERIGFFFTPPFMILSTALIVVAGFVTAANWMEVRLDFPRLYNAPSLLLAYLTMLVVIALHECAHGLTCKFFGGNVREIGFLLLLFQPAFYCNVSDAWLFPRKARRLWVTFAGAYFEIFVWALATLVWRVTEPWTAVNFLALVVMATSGIKTLFNLNPLIKLDGYYLLSDWLGIPNLRQRAFAHLRDRVGHLWGMSGLPKSTATARERRIFWIYGLLAWGYTFWLLGFVLWYLGGWLIGRFQGWGFALFAVLLAGIFQYPLRNLLRVPARALSLKIGMKRWLKWTFRVAVLATVAVVLWCCHTDLRIAGPFTVLPVHNADIRAKVEGILHEIYAEEGDVVKQGDAIASMGDRDYLAELGKTRAEIEEKQARLSLLKAGTRPEELQLARTTAAKAEERTKYARVQLEMEKALFEQTLSSRKDYEEKRELVAVREKEQQEANDHIKLLLAGSRKEEIEATEAEVRRLQAHQRYIEEQLQLLKIVSPVSGVVTSSLPTFDLVLCTILVFLDRMRNASSLQSLSNAHWAHWELAATPLPDQRLRKRLFIMATDLASAPDASIPKALVSWAKIKAAYRFLAHDELSPAQLLDGHRHATLQRLDEQPVVLVVQDTTTLNYSTHLHTQGLGRTTTGQTRGLFLHSTFAFTPAGLPLGILHAQMWSRDPQTQGQHRQRNGKPLDKKESHKWMESFAATAAVAHPRVVSIADREGDLYELLAAALVPGAPALLVRAQHNRQVVDGAAPLLWEHIDAQPAAANVEIALPRRPGVAARRALCEIRFGSTTLQAPLLKEQQPALEGICFIDVRETGGPAGQAIHWRLLTTLKVASLEQAREKVRWYLVRWQIEVFHRTLKSGCAVERLQLDSLAKLERAIALKMIIAWRVMALAQCSREASQTLATQLLAREEVVVLLAVTKTPQTVQTLTVRQAVRAIAGLGGFLGRKGDGEPGVMTLWRGLQRLHDMTAAALALKSCG